MSKMRMVASPVARCSWSFVVSSCLLAALTGGCSKAVADSSACGNLVYTEPGLSRKEYLPCAGEMIAALDKLEPEVRAAFRGDRQARTDGQATLRRLESLMKEAGGRNLLERWRDTALTDLNVDMHNAVSHYQAFYWVRILQEPDPRAALTRRAAEAEMLAAARNSQEARNLYRRLR